MNENKPKMTIGNVIRHPLLKTVMIIVFVLSFLASLATMFAIILLTELNFYTDPTGGKTALEDVKALRVDSYLQMMRDIPLEYDDQSLIVNGNGAYTSVYTQYLNGKNFAFVFSDTDGNLIYTTPEYDKFQNYSEYRGEYSLEYPNIVSEFDVADIRADYEFSHDPINNFVSDYIRQHPKYSGTQIGNKLFFYEYDYRIVRYVCRIANEPPIMDGETILCKVFETANEIKSFIPYIMILSMLLFVLSSVMLIRTSGRRIGEEHVIENFIDKIPYELFLFLLVCVGFVLTLPIDYFIYSYNLSRYFDISLGIGMSAIPVIGLPLLLALLLTSTSTRIKTHRIFKNTFVGMMIRFIKRIAGKVLRALPVVWTEMIAFILFGFANLVLMSVGAWLLLIPLWIGAVALLMYIVMKLHTLYLAAKMMADGNINTKVLTDGMYGGIRRHAEHLNCIADGMNVALDERMKSERMKTELITNVSHDIKTPLTSIINYVDLLEKEGSSTDTGREYLEVLERQTRRLKKLIEDLIQASKASTGNIETHMMATDVMLICEQVIGEYSERFAELDLELVMSGEVDGIKIECDGQLLWRIFDNLLSNICKYSLRGTRVYLDIEQVAGRVEFVLRNISAVPLHISPDELTERFVRGDSSRNTEGSGLGLSIAKSLAELQGATLSLAIDGDLFKATLSFEEYMGQ